MKRIMLLLAAIAGVIFLLAFVNGKQAAQPVAAAPQPVELQQQIEKPIEGWTICQDLGVGPIPGVNQPRQRFKLCHPDGWEITTYCLRPDLPAPVLGAACVRLNADTYSCGNGIQPVREYQVNQTPTAVFTPTATASPGPTATQTTVWVPSSTPTLLPYPTSTPTRRAPPGGVGFAELIRRVGLQLFQPVQSTPFLPVEPSPTPFRPLHPTAELSAAAVILLETPQPAQLPPEQSFQGISFWDDSRKVHIRIYPDRNKINRGQPIDLEFFPAPDCQFGDGQACANVFRNMAGGEINFLTIHSGIGGEAQELRHALEGTSFDRAALKLNQVERNILALTGAEVLILQDEHQLQDLEIAALVRIPAELLQEYINTPVDRALEYAAQLEPSLQQFIYSAEPILVLETCGWKMPGERSAPGITDTSASIYIVIIRARSS